MSNDPLHGITLQAILEDLVARHGWPALGEQVPIRCFTHEPSVASSLKFLRRTPWARARVEAIYVADQQQLHRRRKSNLRRASLRAQRTDGPATDGEATPLPAAGQGPKSEL